MYAFSYPWLFLLLPLPLAIRFLLPPYQESTSGIRAPWFNRIAQLFGVDPTKDAVVRANERWKAMLASYEAPPIDAGTDEALTAFIAKKKESLPDGIG